MVDNSITNILVIHNSLLTYHKVHYIALNHKTITYGRQRMVKI